MSKKQQKPTVPFLPSKQGFRRLKGHLPWDLHESTPSLASRWTFCWPQK